MSEPTLSRLEFHFMEAFAPGFLKQWLCLCLLWIGLCMSQASLTAQSISSQNQPAQSGAIPILHMETNLVQIPVLVLTPALKKLSSPVASDRFSITFNSDTPFRPTYSRIEGADPIHLAIVLDTRSLKDDLLSKIDGAIAGLAPSFLHPNDLVSIYVMSCGQMEEVRDVPGDSFQLKNAADVALRSWTARRQSVKAAPCSSNANLWDDLAYVTNALAKQSGWRAILAVTDGNDTNSKYSSDAVTKMAQHSQVTIFGLNPDRSGSNNHVSPSAGVSQPTGGLQGLLQPTQIQPGFSNASNDVGITRLSAVSKLTGGVSLALDNSNIAARMQQFTQMLRDRYILEFPRPRNAKAGVVLLTVKVHGVKAIALPAGDLVPVDNQDLVPDSNQISTVATALPQPPANPESTAPAELAPPADRQPMPAQSAAVGPADAPVPTQQESSTPEPSASYSVPHLKVTSEITVEDVTVTDRHRNPVHGLQQPNFELKEDGHVQKITNFEEFGMDKPSENAAPAQSPANVFSNAQPQAPTTGALNVLLLDDVATGLVDHLKWAPENLEAAKEQSIKYLNRLPQGTQVAILQLGNTAQVLQGFTADKAVLLAAMKAASFKPAGGANAEPSKRNPTGLDASRDRQVLCEAANAQSELTVAGLKAVADYLSGIKGRKNLIWFTPGIPWLTNYAGFSGVKCLGDRTEELQRVYALLSDAQVALYPIDPRGLVADNALSAVDSSIAVGGMMRSRQMGARVAKGEMAFNAGSSEEHESLRAMADATGGISYFNRNDLDGAIQEAIETGANYYSLAYVPPLSGHDGKYHTIDVKVDRPDLHLLYRPGYTSVDAGEQAQPSADSSPEASAQRKLLAGMVHGQAPSTQLLFDVRVTPSTDPQKPGDPQVIGSLNPTVKHLHLVRYDMAFSLAPDQVSLLEATDGRRKASIEFGFVAYDGEGKMLNSIQKTVRFTVNPQELAQYLQQPLRVPLKFDLPSGSIFVRVGVMDLASQKMGTLEIPETVAK